MKRKKNVLEQQPVLCCASLLPLKVQFMFLGMSSGRAVSSLALRERIEVDWLQANGHNLPMDRDTSQSSHSLRASILIKVLRQTTYLIVKHSSKKMYVVWIKSLSFQKQLLSNNQFLFPPPNVSKPLYIN